MLNLTPVPLDVIPFYVRAGTILPLGPVIQSTDEAEDPLEIRIYPGADAAFSLYEDDGNTYAYEKEFSPAFLCSGTTNREFSPSVIGKATFQEC